MNHKVRNPLLLTLAAMVWGVAFVAQDEGSNYIGSCSFTGIRFLIAAAVLFPFIRLMEARRKSDGPSKKLWISGIICGVLLCAASLLQQEGIALGTNAGKAGFLTALYIVLVPLANLLFFRKRTALTVWIGVALALAGIYLLCMKGVVALNLPDLLVILSAFLFALQILAVDRFSPLYSSLKLAAIQFLTCGAISSLIMIPVDILPIGFNAWLSTFTAPGAWMSLVFASVFSGAMGYTLQIAGQKGVNPAVASLIMSLESLFAVLAGWLILHQTMTPREMAGAALIFAAVLLAQVPARKRK